MARVAGVDLPPNKRAQIGLTYIYGVGKSRATAILNEADISVDSKIRDHAPNALRDLVAGLPQLKAIAFNGGTAAAIGRKQLGLETGHALIPLPSSSAALTRPFDAKLAEWMALKAFL